MRRTSNDDQGRPYSNLTAARANLACQLATVALQGRKERRVRLHFYDGSYLVTLRGAKNPEGIGAISGAAKAILQAEGWPLSRVNSPLTFELIDVDHLGNTIDLRFKCPSVEANPNLIISMPILPQYMDFLALGDCMDATITHMTRQQPPSENLLLEAWQLAHDLKFTHPVARHLRRIRSALCDPYIQALIGTIREKSNTHTPFRSAAVTGLGEGIANLQNHLKNDQITLIDRSCTNLTIESTRNRGLRTVQAEIDDPSPKALRDLKVDLAFCPDLLQGACTGFPAALTNLANVIIPGGWIIITIRRINQFLTPDGVIEEMESGNADLQSSMLKAMLEQSPHFTDVTTMTGPHAGLDDFFLARRAQS